MADKTKSTSKRAAKKPARATPPNRKNRESKTGVFASVQTFLEDPYAMDRLKERLPSWADEVGGLTLITIGMLTFAAVINPSGEAALSAPMATALRQIFGIGAFLVAIALFSMGVILLLPKVGIRIRFNWLRIVAIEVLFVGLEALFHLLSFTDEGRALARNGDGGGYVGWTVSSMISSFTGRWLAIIIFSVLAFYSLSLLLGITRRDIRTVLLGISEGLKRLSQRYEPAEPPVIVSQVETADVPSHVETDPAPVAEASTEADPIATSAFSDEPAVDVPDVSPATPVDLPAQPASLPDELPSTHFAQASAASGQSVSHPPVESPPVTLPGQYKDQPASDSTEHHSRPTLNEPAAENSVETQAPSTPEYKTLVINGEEVQVPVNHSLEDDGNEGSEAGVGFEVEAQRRRLEGKRYFTVDGFHDRYFWMDERDPMLPPMELLNYADLKLPSEEEVNTNARIIENTMNEFDIDADVIDVRIGPTVTQYAVSPIKEVIDPDGTVRLVRTRVSKIANLSSDFALALSTKRLRIQAPVPGYSHVGIEVPNREPSLVSIRSVMETETFYRKRHLPLSIPLGRDVSGDPVLADLATMPHLLIAGTTGSGKSVCLTSVIASLVMNNMPDRVRLILLDPKMVELTRFGGLPHLMGPVETDVERIIGVLRWAAREMDRRYKLLEMENARHLEAYNTILGQERKEDHLPYIVIVIDEIGDLMMSRPDETEKTLTRLAQKARAAGMHLIVATQRPSVDVITGLIKANFPARLSFAVASGTDSRVILDSTGAETLVGRGDMLFLSPEAASPTRLQGCFISDSEIEEIVLYWQAWQAEQLEALPPDKVPETRVAPWEQSMTRLEALTRLDPMLEDALQMVVAEGRASVSQIQKRMGIDYPRAARIMDSLRDLGIIGGTLSGGTNRKVLVKSVEEARRMIHNNRRANQDLND